MRKALGNLLVTLLVVLVMPVGLYSLAIWAAGTFTNLSAAAIVQLASQAGAAGVVLGFVVSHRSVRSPRQRAPGHGPRGGGS